MALGHYGVLARSVAECRAEGGADTPHFQIRVHAAGTDFRVAVNVMSQQVPPDLLYLADEAFHHPVVQDLPSLPDGFTALPSQAEGAALDYIRGDLFDRTLLRTLPPTQPGPDNDLADRLSHYLSRASAEPGARLYAFGERWGPEASTRDKIFGFVPGNGVHDVHMNQGNNGSFVSDDGVWQDGGLILHFPSNSQWVAIFLAFQSQVWHTDDRTGHALPGDEQPDRLVRIVAALINPVGPAPEQEAVTLINPGSQDLNLDGWALLDRLKQRMPLDPVTLVAGETTRVWLRPPIQLGNKGGLITLVNPDGLKVDGVAYTEQDARKEGATLVF
jgi:uncharacterized protein YukJ